MSLLSSNDFRLYSKRGRESRSGRRLGTMILVLLIGIDFAGILQNCFYSTYLWEGFHLNFIIDEQAWK